MNHTIWIISACFGSIIGRAIYDKYLGYLVPAIIGVVVTILIAGNILPL